MQVEKDIMTIASRIRALSQTGLVYASDEYNTERYEELLALSNQITALVTNNQLTDIESCYRIESDYVTPKVDIRAVVFNDKNEILLVQERTDSKWQFPEDGLMLDFRHQKLQ